MIRIAFAVPGSFREEEDEVAAGPVALTQQNQITVSLAVQPRCDH